MKKANMLILAVMLVTAALLLSSCGNMTLVDTTYRFDRAQILMPDGSVVEGKVETWTSYGHSDLIRVKIGDLTYLTNDTNVVLMTGH